MSKIRQALYSSVLEDCKVSTGSCYLEEAGLASQRGKAVSQRMRAEIYLFFSILNLRERAPVISASQAIDSDFMLGYARRCQNPVTGENPFLETLRRGYIKVFFDDESTSLREYLRGCLKRDIRVVPSGAASPRFIFSSISSVSSRSVPKEPRFPGDTEVAREHELMALYGDMLARVECGRRGLPGLIDHYYVTACEWGWKERSASLLRGVCETFVESLRLYSMAAKKGYRLLPERASCAFITELGLHGRVETVLNEGRVTRLKAAVTDTLEVYNEIASGLLVRDADVMNWARSLSDDQLRMLLHALETINQVECYFETVDMIDKSTRSACVHAQSAKGYLGPWCRQKLSKDYSALIQSGQKKEAHLAALYLGAGVGKLSRRSEMYNLLDRCSQEHGELLGLTKKEVEAWVSRTRALIDDAYKDVMFLGAFGSVGDIDSLAIACADIGCSSKAESAYKRLLHRCHKEARAALTGPFHSISRSEEESLATSLCWGHFLLCKERMSAYANRNRRGADAENNDAERSSADLARFRRMLPLRTFGHFVALFLIYAILSLLDNAFFDPQGWVANLILHLGITLPEVGSLVIQSTVFIFILIAYELIANQIGILPSVGEVASLWRSFLMEREIVTLVQGISDGVLAERDEIDRLLTRGHDIGRASKSSEVSLSQSSLELIEFTHFVRGYEFKVPSAGFSYDATLHRMRDVAREMGNIMLRATIALEGADRKGSERNLVTRYDREIQTSIERLLSEDEGVSFLAEEEVPPVANGVARGDTYVIDPIDGTSNFIFAVGHSCVSIARRDAAGRVTLGVVYDPSKDECFWAALGAGAYCNDRRLTLLDGGPSFAGTLGCVGTSPYNEDFLARFPRLAQVVLDECADIRRTGSSALDLCYVAAGRFSVYVEAGLSAWDVAAGALIVSEAGGKVVTFDGESPLGVEELEKISVVAGTSSRVGLMLKRVRPIFSSDGADFLLAANRFVSLVEIRYRGEDGRMKLATRLDVLPSMEGVVLAIRRNGELLLLCHYRPAVNEVLFEMPRGCVEKGETSEEAARRELLEETGLSPVSMRCFGELLPDSGVLSTRVGVFLVEVAHDEGPRMLDENEEIAGFHFVTRPELAKLISSGKLVDGITLASISILGDSLWV